MSHQDDDPTHGLEGDPLETQPAQGFGAPVEFVDPPAEEHLYDDDPGPGHGGDDGDGGGWSDEIAADRARRWTAHVIIAVALVMAFFNGPAIRTWASTLPPDWTTETIRQLAQVWTDRLALAGFDAPRATVHEAYESGKSVGWDGKTKPGG